MTPSQTLLIKGNRIISIGDSVKIPKAARVIKAQGKYLIPGLWDMHSHVIEYSEVQQLSLAHGITGLREMNGNFKKGRVMDSLWNENQPSTRFIVGHMIDGAGGRSQIAANTPAEAIKIVDSMAQHKASFLKPYSSLEPDVFVALMNRAKERGIPVAGHIPDRVHTLKVAELGYRSIEHSAIILKDCTPLAGKFDEEYVKALNMENDSLAHHAYIKIMGKELSSFDENICRKIARELSAYGTAVTPTLIIMYKTWHRPLANFHKDPNIKYMPKYMRKTFEPDFAPFTEEEWKIGQDQHPINMKLVKILNEEGVLLLAGSDPGLAIPGFGLHEELELLVEAGLTPLEALQTATINPAIFLNHINELGTVETGKLADLVLLNANPLKDISNTTDIHAVVIDGEYLDRNRLDKLMEKAASKYND